MRQGTIGAAGKHDGYARAHYNAAGLRIGQVLQLLGQHIARLQIWHDQDVGLTCDHLGETHILTASSLLLCGTLSSACFSLQVD